MEAENARGSEKVSHTSDGSEVHKDRGDSIPGDNVQSRGNFVRRLYDWVLSWADSRYGVLALAILSFAESSFFPIPPDVLLIGLAVGAPKRALRFATVCSLASVVGGVVGYAIGHFVWLQTQAFFFSHVPGFTPAVFGHVQELFETYSFWVIFAAGFTPIPYKVFTISAGVFGIQFPMFVLASFVGRSARFFLVAGLIYFFGPKIRDFIDRYFNYVVILFFILLAGGFALIKMFGH